MAKIVVMNIPAYGHVNPTLPVVAELVRRGNHVIYYNSEEFRTPIEQTGAEFRPYPHSVLFGLDFSKVTTGSLIKVTILIFQGTAELLGFTTDELAQEKPDVVMYDSICLWAMLAAQKLKLRSVSSNAIFILEGLEAFITWREVALIARGIVQNLVPFLRAFMKLRKRLTQGQRIPNPIFPCAGDVNLVYTARELQPPTKYVNDTFKFVGPTIDESIRTGEFPFDQIQRRPLIYISLGTINNNKREFYQRCFEAFGDHAGQVVLAVGRHTNIGALGEIPANFIVRPQVPQLEILQRADLFITHAGMNSVQESLYYGVPMILIPHQMEQLINAKVVAHSGAGVMLGNALAFGKMTAQELRAAADQVLQSPSYCQAAQHISAELRAAGGYRKAADLILSHSMSPIPEQSAS